MKSAIGNRQSAIEIRLTLLQKIASFFITTLQAPILLSLFFGTLLIALPTLSYASGGNLTASVLPIDIDTFVRINNVARPDDHKTNFGNDPSLYVAGEQWVSWGAGRTLIKIDPTAIPRDATQIKLKLYMTGLDVRVGYDAKIDLYKITQDWNEQTVTWDTKPTFDNSRAYSSLIINHDAPLTWYEWDITSLVKEWQAGTSANYGFLLYDRPDYSGGGLRMFHSSDSTDTAKRPYIEYIGGNLPNELGDSDQTIFDVTISLYNNPTTPTEQAKYKEIINYWADGIYEQTNGAHYLGNVHIHRNGENSSNSNLLWVECEWPRSNTGGFNFYDDNYVLGKIYFGDKFDEDGNPNKCSDNIKNNYLTESEGAIIGGYVLAHEWGHYVYSLYDEYVDTKKSTTSFWQPRATDKTPKTPSIMNDQEYALNRHWWGGFDFNYKWLNHSMPYSYLYAQKPDTRLSFTDTAQGRVYEASAWQVLVRNKKDDPKMSSVFNAFPPRVHYKALDSVAPQDARFKYGNDNMIDNAVYVMLTKEPITELDKEGGQQKARNKLNIIWEPVSSIIASTSIASTNAYQAGLTTFDGNKNVSYPKPVLLTAHISKHYPITGVNIAATLTAPNGTQSELVMRDDGTHADAIKEDGVYTAELLDYTQNGAYTVNLSVDNANNLAHFTDAGLSYVPASDGSTPPPMTTPVGENFTQSATLQFTISGVPASGDDHPNTPPGTGMLADNRDVAGRIDQTGDVDYFSLTGLDTAQDVIVRLTGLSTGLQPVLTVYRADGVTVIASGDLTTSPSDRGYPYLRIPASQLGTGALVMSVTSATTTGTYNISAGQEALASDVPPNQAPQADAGTAKTVRPGSAVTLSGSGFDPDNGPSPTLSFAWAPASGVNASLNGADTATPTFTPTAKGVYALQLVVSDGKANSVPAVVNITVPRLGDIDQDDDVDNNDLSRITAMLNKPASNANDLRDINGDMTLNTLDARKLALLCTRPRCATQ